MAQRISAIEALNAFVPQLKISKEDQSRLLLLIDEADAEAYDRGRGDGYESGYDSGYGSGLSAYNEG